MKILSERQKRIIRTEFYKNWKSCENETKQINNTITSAQQPMMFVLTNLMRNTGVLEEINYKYSGNVERILNELDLKCATCGKKINAQTLVGRYLGNDLFWQSFGDLAEQPKQMVLKNNPRRSRPKNRRIENYKKKQILSAQKNNNRVKYPKFLVASIDDSSQAIKMMQQIIGKGGYKFIGIQDSLQVLPTLIEYNPDLIFLDIEMPIFNGHEICHQIRNVSKLKNKPIVMLSANTSIKNKFKAKMAGATEFIDKPIEVAKIVAILEKYLPRKRTPEYLAETQLNGKLTWQI